MRPSVPLVALFFANACVLSAQTPKPDTTSAETSKSTQDYPKDQTGVLIKGIEWTEVSQVIPSKTRMKHGVAAAFTYGAVPAKAVMEYAGQHAEIVLSDGRPAICVCYTDLLGKQPVLLRLHAKKNSRELVSARAPIMDSTISEAAQSDLVEIDVSTPESMVWLLRPRKALPPGEYAVMLETQNMGIFPFTVTNSDKAAAVPNRR